MGGFSEAFLTKGYECKYCKGMVSRRFKNGLCRDCRPYAREVVYIARERLKTMNSDIQKVINGVGSTDKLEILIARKALTEIAKTKRVMKELFEVAETIV